MPSYWGKQNVPTTGWSERVGAWTGPSEEEIGAWGGGDLSLGDIAKRLNARFLQDTDATRLANPFWLRSFMSSQTLPFLKGMVQKSIGGMTPDISSSMLKDYVTGGAPGIGKGLIQQLLAAIQSGRGAPAGETQRDISDFWWGNPELLTGAMSAPLAGPFGSWMQSRMQLLLDAMKAAKWEEKQNDWLQVLLGELPGMGYQWPGQEQAVQQQGNPFGYPMR